LVVIGLAASFSNGGFRSSLIAGGAIVVLSWQMIEGPLLFVRRLQAPILLISLALLGVIAVSGIQMFPAMLLPLLFAFIPDHVFHTWKNQAIIRAGSWKIHCIYLCLFINLFGAMMMYVSESIISIYDIKIFPPEISQIFFLGSILLLLAPLVREIMSPDRVWKWEGVKVWDGTAPKIFILFPIILFIWGMTPYVGLRTTGNFSMFSNLRTEGLESNHIILGGNILKVWDYQEDRVKVIDIDDETAEVGHHYQPLKGLSLPVTEFRKLVNMWRESNKQVAMTYQYQSDPDPVQTQDIVSDSNWASAGRNWETFWLDFRPVQDAGPNLCRW
jgi:hypothetical protein